MSWAVKLQNLQEEISFWSPAPIQVRQLLRSDDIRFWVKELLGYAGQEASVDQIEAFLQGRDSGNQELSVKTRVSNAYALFADVEENSQLLTSKRLARWQTTWNRNIQVKDQASDSGGLEASSLPEVLVELLTRHQQTNLLMHPVQDLAWFFLEFIRVAPFRADNPVLGMVSINYLLHQKNYPWVLFPWPNHSYSEKLQVGPLEPDCQAVAELAELLAQALVVRMESELAVIKAHAGSGQCGVGGPRLISLN